MQLIHDFGISLKQYLKLGKENQFPEFPSCPCCFAQKPLLGHGFYERNAVKGKTSQIVLIQRYYCSCCKKTFSVLPSFLHPRFQYTLEYIMLLLQDIFLEKKNRSYRQLRYFYKHRFLKNINRLQMFFRDQDPHLQFPDKTIEKAIKLIEIILEITGSFSRRFQGKFGTAFMAI